MEHREKKARLHSLARLKRLRTEGGTRLEVIDNHDEGEETAELTTAPLDEDYDVDEGQFIEHVDTARTFKSRPSAFSLRPAGKMVGNSMLDTTTVLKGDDYFQSLMAQMEASASENEPETDTKDGISRANSTARVAGKNKLLPSQPVQTSQSRNLSREPSTSSLNLMDTEPPTVVEARTTTSSMGAFDIIPDFFAPSREIVPSLMPSFLPTTDPILTSEAPMMEEDEAAEWFDDAANIDLAIQIEGKEVTATSKVSTGAETPMQVEPAETSRGMQVQQADVMEEEEASAHPVLASPSSNMNLGDMVNFYWLDAYEKPNSGVLYLFGKVPSGHASSPYASACVIVSGVRRNVFFLPRETISDGDTGAEREVTLKDVHEEISRLITSQRITLFGCKLVQRRYAFEIPDIPMEADYVKLVYPFSSPALVTTGAGRTFSHVFGTNTSALELFLLKRRIMGPCWLQFPASALKGSSSGASVSWCRRELRLEDPKAIRVLVTDAPPTPPLTVLSLSLRTIVEPQSRTHEVVAISGLAYSPVPIEGGPCDKGIETVRCIEAFSVARETENSGGFTAKFVADTMAAYRDPASISTTTTSLPSSPLASLELAKNERALLTYLIARIYRLDPDVIVGHNFLGFDLGVLLHRMRANKVDYWSRLGRLSWSQWPRGKPGSTEASYAERLILSGRLVCDTYLAAKDLVRSRNYSLSVLVESQLGGGRVDLDWERVQEHFETPKQLAHLLRHCEGDAHWIMRLMMQLMILPLTKQLTNIAGNLWARTLVGGRAERNEYLLLHEFHRLKYIVPDKAFKPAGREEEPPVGADYAGIGMEGGEEENYLSSHPDHFHGGASQAKGSSRRKAAYAGGLVLEPKKGLYRNIVLLLDFNSLYPSIIQEFNICFTTVERTVNSNGIDGGNAATANPDAMPPLPEPSCPQGVLPRLLAGLVARRREIKRLMKDPRISPAEAAQLHIRQQALKLTANSMYGCLGFAQSRFHARPLASLITGKGREILANTVELARGACHLEVVYGDTDSVMVHTGTRDLPTAKRMAQDLKRAVNERYRLLEIELDGVFGALLLLKKKKYAALILEEHADGSISQRIESKGLDLVRRDWCALSVDTSTVVLEKILLSEDSKGDLSQDSTVQGVADQIHVFLRTVADEVNQGSIPLEKYIISKNLTKEPEQYADAKNQPHVMVALRMRERGLAVRSGDTIPYVICRSTSGGGNEGTKSQHTGTGLLTERAHHPDDVRRDHLLVDTEWYLAQQVHPCVSRLCDHLPGTDTGRLASALGLDATKYYQPQSQTREKQDHTGQHQSNVPSFMLTNEERFRQCAPLTVICPGCGHSLAVSSLNIMPVSCPGCTLSIPPISLHYQVRTAVHRLLAAYYAGWVECDEATCRARTRQLRLYEERCPIEGCRGTVHHLVSGREVYQQLLYYRSLLESGGKKTASVASVDAGKKSISPPELDALRHWLTSIINKCAYPIVNLAEIFSFVKRSAGMSIGSLL